jgi:hypothetical protein
MQSQSSVSISFDEDYDDKKEVSFIEGNLAYKFGKESTINN